MKHNWINLRKIGFADLILSFGAAVSLGFLIYTRYLQSFGYSLKRLFFGVLVVLFFSFLFGVITRLILSKYSENKQTYYKAIGFWMLISLLLTPYFLPIPHYPVADVFRHTSSVEIKMSAVDEAELIQLKGVWLEFEDTQISSSDFSFSQNWIDSSGKKFLKPNTVGELYWHGKVGELAKLSIFSMDTKMNVIVIWDGKEEKSILTDKTLLFQKKSTTPAWYYMLIVAAQSLFFGFLAFVFFSFLSFFIPVSWKSSFIAIFLLFLAFFAVYEHFQSPDITNKFDLQISYHENVLSGNSTNPWQYRLFSEWIVESAIRLVSLLPINATYYWGFALVRIVQNVLIYFLTYFYYRKLGYSKMLTLVGLLFVTGSLLNSFHKSGFSINTYFDLIFYLSAVLIILNNSINILPFLMIFASLNRETSGLIPFMVGMVFPGRKNEKIILTVTVTILALLFWLVPFVLLRVIYPDVELFIPYGHPPGIPLLLYNLSSEWLYLLFRFFGFVPVFGLVFFPFWPDLLKRLFVILVPVWIVVHLFASVISETRLFLVPQILVLIPGFLVCVQYIAKRLNTNVPYLNLAEL